MQPPHTHTRARHTHTHSSTHAAERTRPTTSSTSRARDQEQDAGIAACQVSRCTLCAVDSPLCVAGSCVLPRSQVFAVDEAGQNSALVFFSFLSLEGATKFAEPDARQDNATGDSDGGTPAVVPTALVMLVLSLSLVAVAGLFGQSHRCFR